MKKIKKPNLQKVAAAVKARRPRRKAASENSLEQAIQNLPRITNETVAEHREEVLSSARKYIYPLKHSARRVVFISTSLFATVVVLFLVYSVVALYKLQSTSGFMYDVAQVIPFPVAKAGPHFISFESYLFELRHYIHYYQTQEKVDFSSASGKSQLDAFRTQALQQVIDDAYVKQLASVHHIHVSDQEVNNEITLVRAQNRLGSNEQVFEAVLKEFWGWSVDDFKRELKQQMLSQKVVAALDTKTQGRAQNVLNQLHAGADFATLAQQNSDDTSTAGSGGAYGEAITRNDPNIPPQVVNAIFKLAPGQTSDIINTGAALEIVKVTSAADGKVNASHIQFLFQPIDTYIAQVQGKTKPHIFISH